MITKSRKPTIARPTTLMELLTPGTQNFCEIVTYFVCHMQDGISHILRRTFSFGLVPPECNDPVNEDTQVNKHSDMFNSKKMSRSSQVTVQQVQDDRYDGPCSQAIAHRHYM